MVDLTSSLVDALKVVSFSSDLRPVVYDRREETFSELRRRFPSWCGKTKLPKMTFDENPDYGQEVQP